MIQICRILLNLLPVRRRTQGAPLFDGVCARLVQRSPQPRSTANIFALIAVPFRSISTESFQRQSGLAGCLPRLNCCSVCGIRLSALRLQYSTQAPGKGCAGRELNSLKPWSCLKEAECVKGRPDHGQGNPAGLPVRFAFQL